MAQPRFNIWRILRFGKLKGGVYRMATSEAGSPTGPKRNSEHFFHVFFMFFPEIRDTVLPWFCKNSFFEKNKNCVLNIDTSSWKVIFFGRRNMKIQEKTWKLRHLLPLKHKVSKKIFLILCGCVPSGFSIFAREKKFCVKPFNNGPINCVF